MKTKNNCLRLAVLGLAVVISAPVLRADTVTWDRQAFGQQVNTCIGLITWPNNNNWSQDLDQECCDVNCDNGSYVAEPSNWTTAGYPNSSTVDVILGDMGAPGTNLDKAIPNALVHSLTILPVGSLNIEAGSGITVNSLVDLQTDTGDRSLTEGGGGGFAGSITLSAGSTMLKSTGTGAYTIQDVHIDATNATFQVNAGTLVFNTDGSSNFTNCNFTLSTGAVLNLGTDPARIEHFNGTFLGNGGGTLRLSGTELQASTNTVFNMPGNMFQWTGGIIDSGSTRTFTNAGKITIAGPVSLSGSGTSFINNKTVVQTGTGTLNMPQGTGIANTATGTYEIRNDLSITGGSSTFDNSGLLRKSAGTGVVDIFAADGTLNFNHLGGTVQVDTGTVRFGSGTSTGATFVIAPGAAVELTSSVGSTVYTGTYTGSGGGTVRLTQGVLHSANPSATINFPEDMFQWSGGEISAASYPFNNDGFITLVGDVAIEGGLFTNNGTIKGNGSFNLNTVNNNGTIAPGDPVGEIDFG